MLLHEKLKDKRLILASNSPRRRQLLTDAGISFEPAEKYECDERVPADIPISDTAEYIAALKSRAYPKPLAANEILMTADTVVIVGGEVLGKPADAAVATQMLRKLSGCTHQVITGVCLTTRDRTEHFSVTTEVTFRELSDDEIQYYIKKYQPFDKAGAYGIQEWIGYVGCTGLSGSYYNVMGLPVQRIYAELLRFQSSA